MGLGNVTGLGVLTALFFASAASAVDPTVKVMAAQGKTEIRQAKISIGLENANGKVLDTLNWLDKLTIDGANLNVATDVAIIGGGTGMGLITITNARVGPAPGNHTVKITVKLKDGGTATMDVTTINFVE